MTPLVALFLCFPLDDKPRGDRYFRIAVVDDQTGRGVPLVELRTVHGLKSITDSNGVAAFHEPGLMGQSVFFHVRSHGYEFAKDGFGYRGKALTVTAGGGAVLKIKRLNVAERLYRVTGGGIYADSLLVGDRVPLKQPVLNGLVLGSDSVVNALYKDKLYWFWGDTHRPGYPLGNFHVPGAVSELPGKGGVSPERGVELSYFLDDKGFAKKTCEMPGTGPTWITGLTVLGDRMFAGYVKVKPPLTIYERGLCEWDDAAKQFRRVKAFAADSVLSPHGHPVIHKDGEDDYVYFCDPFPLVRVRADVESLGDPTRYEAFTCVTADGKVTEYGWKRNAARCGPKEEAELVRQGQLKESAARWQLRDVETGKTVQAHGGSISWNAYRRRWVLIAVQTHGTSLLGEVWYAEADAPTGPWKQARKIVSHERYDFYNPKQHPYFAEKNGRIIYFEGTYTATFSGNPEKTPRYEYNQMMYRLDLADPRLDLTSRP